MHRYTLLPTSSTQLTLCPNANLFRLYSRRNKIPVWRPPSSPSPDLNDVSAAKFHSVWFPGKLMSPLVPGRLRAR